MAKVNGQAVLRMPYTPTIDTDQYHVLTPHVFGACSPGPRFH